MFFRGRSNSLTTKSVVKIFGPYIEIKVEEALLNSKQTSSPYVIVRIGSEQRSTKILKKTQVPVWNETLSIPMTVSQGSLHESKLEIECWSFGGTKKDIFIGKTCINLENLKNNETTKYVNKLDQVEFCTILFEITPRNYDLKTFRKDKETIARTVIKNKLKSSHYKHFDDKFLENLTQKLSNIDLFKENYLPSSWADILELHRSFTRQSSLINFSMDDLDDLDFTVVEDDEDLQEEIEEEIENEKKFHFEKDIKIKIVFVDQLPENGKKQLIKLITPIATEYGFTNVGFFHTALIIGPWYIEWTSDSLCIPRKCFSKSAFLTVDVGVIATVENLEIVRDKIANVIVDWNSNVTYAKIGNGKNHGNCQNFIDSVLEKLEIESSFSGYVADFINDIKRNGSSKLKFKMNPEFRSKFTIKEDFIIFESHVELDKFVMDLLKIDSSFHINFPNESSLLKSFDRAFWLKNFKYETIISFNQKKIKELRLNSLKFQNQKKMKEMGLEEEYITKMKQKKILIKNVEEASKKKETCSPMTQENCYNNEHVSICPFGNPATTKSFWI
eukprot:gene4965-8559_t